MKNFIAGIAILLLLLIFPLQTALETTNERRLSRFSDIVYIATQTARTDGYFKQATIDKLRNDLKSDFPDLADGDISISVTTTPKYRLNVFDQREAINYNIQIPVRKIIVAAPLLGIGDGDNKYMSQRSGYVLSEVLMP